MSRLTEFNDQPPRMVFISMTNAVGGAENVLQLLANSESSTMIFLKRMFSNVLKAGSGKRTYLTEGSLLLGFIKLVKEVHGYSDGYILFSTHPYLNAYLGILKRMGLIKVPVIVRESCCVFSRYSGLKKLSYSLAYRLGYPAVDLVICQTDLMRTELLQHNNFLSQEKAIVLNNPFDLEYVRSRAVHMPDDEDAAGSYICSAGRLIPIKGFDLLIKAFSRLADSNEDLKLVILGDGKERNKLENLIEELNLKGRVILKGHVGNPIPFFKNAKVCVVSSIQEGFPNVLLEMMAVNPSVVSTLCAGGIENIPSISKVQVNNIEALTAAIQNALEAENASQPEVSAAYLKNRTPDNFMNSALREVSLRYKNPCTHNVQA